MSHYGAIEAGFAVDATGACYCAKQVAVSAERLCDWASPDLSVACAAGHTDDLVGFSWP
jgi:hypothetical protein